MTRSQHRPDRTRFRLGSLNARQSVRAEFDFHIEMTVRELMEAGLELHEAEAEARRRFGRLDYFNDACERIESSDRRRRRWRETMRDLVQDLRFAVRRLAHSPLFTVVSLTTLALGIGANTAAFTLINGVMLQPLPYAEPDGLVALSTHKADDDEDGAFSYPDYLDVGAQSATLEELGFWTWWTMDITDADEPTSVPSVRVSANMLSMLGVEPVAGRLFRGEEGEAGGEDVALVSFGVWQSYYGGEPLVGNSIELDGVPHTVVGVMPEGFRFPYEGDYGVGFWTPLPLDAEENGRNSRWLKAVGRLAPGATIEQARSELETIAARLAAEFPASNTGWTISTASLYDEVVGSDTRAALWILYGVVAFVLLIACANLANLLLARMESRQQELAVRAALGAGRRRLLRELLAESTVMSLAGGVVGIATAAWSTNLLLALMPADLPRLDEITFDTPVLIFAMGVTFGTGILFGLLPALQASRPDLQETLKVSAARGSTGQRFRAALVVAEVAVALVLLIGAGLLLRSFTNLLSEDVGFDPDRVLTFQVSPNYDEAARRIAFYREVLNRLRLLPGVEVAGANTAPPLSGVDWRVSYTVDGEPEPGIGEEPSAQFNVVSPDYFRALSIALVAGRFTTEDDTNDRDRVALVNESLARRHWPQGNAVGRSLSIGARASEGRDERVRPSFQIVGIVADTRKLGIDRDPPAEIYLPYTQSAQYFMNVAVRTQGDPLMLVDAVRAQVWEIDDRVALEDMATMAARFGNSVSEPRFNTALVGAFALLAVVLATLGIYGVVAYAATQRNREIGVRMALGAGNADVFRLLVGQGLMLSGIGVALGIAAALLASRVMASMVYGVTTTDPVTFVAVAVVLTAVALVAAWIPARRATRVDPLVVLRDE